MSIILKISVSFLNLDITKNVLAVKQVMPLNTVQIQFVHQKIINKTHFTNHLLSGFLR